MIVKRKFGGKIVLCFAYFLDFNLYQQYIRVLVGGWFINASPGLFHFVHFAPFCGHHIINGKKSSYTKINGMNPRASSGLKRKLASLAPFTPQQSCEEFVD